MDETAAFNATPNMTLESTRVPAMPPLLTVYT